MNKYKRKGIKSFLKQDFQNAHFCLSEAYRKDPNDREILLFLLLVDFAKTSKDEAMALCEDYQIRRIAKEDKDELISKLIEYLEEDLHFFESLVKSKLQADLVEFDNTISYDDFMICVDSKGNFKKAFEDIMFSTRVMISNKEDFADFLEKLIDNNFIEISLNYIESASRLFPNEEVFKELLQKAIKRQNS